MPNNRRKRSNPGVKIPASSQVYTLIGRRENFLRIFSKFPQVDLDSRPIMDCKNYNFLAILDVRTGKQRANKGNARLLAADQLLTGWRAPRQPLARNVAGSGSARREYAPN